MGKKNNNNNEIKVTKVFDYRIVDTSLSFRLENIDQMKRMKKMLEVSLVDLEKAIKELQEKNK